MQSIEEEESGPPVEITICLVVAAGFPSVLLLPLFPHACRQMEDRASAWLFY